MWLIINFLNFDLIFISILGNVAKHYHTAAIVVTYPRILVIIMFIISPYHFLKYLIQCDSTLLKIAESSYSAKGRKSFERAVGTAFFISVSFDVYWRINNRRVIVLTASCINVVLGEMNVLILSKMLQILEFNIVNLMPCFSIILY